ncbi:MAG: tRNA (adenosine(37)-N6)-threonylcarbamoyltransferase complex transferase subunit TsaD [Candidatus Pacearchaeota archaeon]|nr:tRNA (adenosine(37)-N6)-threonylcarbamoyltransferase complex transferase subunit TsaD [Candidatus Pacearchaeota archaeon]
MVVLGIESTAHTFGIGIVENGKILANVKKTYTTEKGGIIPIEAAKHHKEKKEEIYLEALNKASIQEDKIDAIAFSQGPGLSPCLLEGLRFTKELSKKLNKPIIPVNHCIAHLEIGRLTHAEDPVMLYVSGANTQIIAYSANRYRIFGETLDVGVGNFIDNFARFIGIGFPGGPMIQKLAEQGKSYIELPYTVKGMDITLSGILTNLKQKVDKINRLNNPNLKTLPTHPNKDNFFINNHIKLRASGDERDYTIADLAFSMQETVFAMLVEVAERALAHTGKKQLLLGGGVACNSRLQNMAKIMCEERDASFFCPENSLLVDNGAMIAYLGEIMFSKGIHVKPEEIDGLDIKPRQRTDEVEVSWK